MMDMIDKLEIIPNRTCILLEDVSPQRTSYKATITGPGTYFQGVQFPDHIFKRLVQHEMFKRREGSYNEFYFECNVQSEVPRTIIRDKNHPITPIDINPLRDMVHKLVEYIEENILDVELVNHMICTNCGFDGFDMLDIYTTKGQACNVIKDQQVQLKVCQKCGTTTIQ